MKDNEPTLRDFFAAHAMGNLITDLGYQQHTALARLAYSIADAMLKQREVTK